MAVLARSWKRLKNSIWLCSFFYCQKKLHKKLMDKKHFIHYNKVVIS